MKLRLGPGKISYRLDYDELEELLSRGEIQESVSLPEGAIHYRVACLPDGAAALFEADGSRFTLSLARDIVANHKTALPSLKGIVSRFQTSSATPLEVALEVNLQKKTKRALR